MAQYSESFNVADQSTLGPDLTWAQIADNGGSGFAIVTQKAQPTVTASRHHARADHDTAGSAVFAQATIILPTTSVTYVDAVVTARHSASNIKTYYGAAIHTNGTTYSHSIRKWTNNVEVDLTSRTAFTWTNGGVLRLEVDGSTLRLLVNGTQLATVSDSSFATGTRAGISTYSSNHTVASTYDDFSFGDLSAVTLTTVRPNATTTAGGWTTGAASLHAALSDQSDATIITGTGA